VPPRSERTALRERYDRRQAQVVLDAARVFAEQGYDQTSVPELAESLGIASGGLYHYFAGKEQLLIAICDQLMEPLLADARELVSASDDPPAQQLEALIRLWVQNVITYRDHMLVFEQERPAIEHGEQWRRVRESRKRFERLVVGVLERVDDEGGLRLGDVRLTLSALLGMVNYTAQWYRPRGRLTAAEIADGYVELVLRAR
jgi:TetR/AcrR family transcriptional regulator, cholesterol catabolism regulator